MLFASQIALRSHGASTSASISPCSRSGTNARVSPRSAVNTSATQRSPSQNWRAGSAPSPGKNARVKAPTSAPSPIDAIRNPNPDAPAWSTWSAKSGMSVSRFIANSEKTATSISSSPTTGSRTTYEAPSASRRRHRWSCCSRATAGRLRISSSAATAAR